MPDNVLGPRVTGLPVSGLPGYKPMLPPTREVIEEARTAVQSARMVAMKKAGLDHVEVEYEVSTRKPTGFNIHLAREKKTIFMPIREAEVGVSMMDLVLLGDHPEKFGIKHANRMIVAARVQLRGGTVGTPDELQGYLGEAWMSPEQVAVLADLREDRG